MVNIIQGNTLSWSECLICGEEEMEENLVGHSVVLEGDRRVGHLTHEACLMKTVEAKKTEGINPSCPVCRKLVLRVHERGILCFRGPLLVHLLVSRDITYADRKKAVELAEEKKEVFSLLEGAIRQSINEVALCILGRYEIPISWKSSLMRRALYARNTEVLTRLVQQ